MMHHQQRLAVARRKSLQQSHARERKYILQNHDIHTTTNVHGRPYPSATMVDSDGGGVGGGCDPVPSFVCDRACTGMYVVVHSS